MQPNFDIEILSPMAPSVPKKSLAPSSFIEGSFQGLVSQENKSASNLSSVSLASSKELPTEQGDNQEEDDALSVDGEAAVPALFSFTEKLEIKPKELFFAEKILPPLDEQLTLKKLDEMLEEPGTELITSEALFADPMFFDNKDDVFSKDTAKRFFTNFAGSLTKDEKFTETGSFYFQEETEVSPALPIQDASSFDDQASPQDESSQENLGLSLEQFKQDAFVSASSFETALNAEVFSVSSSVVTGHQELPAPIHTVSPSETTLATQVLDQIPRALFSVQGNHQIKIQLYPEELGAVMIHLKIGDQQKIEAIFSAASTGTLDLLRQESSQLLQALKKEGFDVTPENFQFNTQQDNAQDRSFQRPLNSTANILPTEGFDFQNDHDTFERRAFSLKRLENNLIDIRVH